MKMIVTGSEGFIGKALCQELKRRDVEVIGIDRKNGKDARKHLRHPQKRRYRLCIPPGRTDFRIQWKHPPNPERQH